MGREEAGGIERVGGRVKGRRRKNGRGGEGEEIEEEEGEEEDEEATEEENDAFESLLTRVLC